MALRNRHSGAGSKPPTGAVVKSHGAERDGKRPDETGQVCAMKLNESEGFEEASLIPKRSRNQVVFDLTGTSLTET